MMASKLVGRSQPQNLANLNRPSPGSESRRAWLGVPGCAILWSELQVGMKCHGPTRSPFKLKLVTSAQQGAPSWPPRRPDTRCERCHAAWHPDVWLYQARKMWRGLRVSCHIWPWLSQSESINEVGHASLVRHITYAKYAPRCTTWIEYYAHLCIFLHIFHQVLHICAYWV